MKTFIELLISGVGSAGAIGLRKYFFEALTIPQPVDIILAASIGALIVIVLRYALIELPYTFAWSRKRLDKRAIFEGLYYEAFDARDSNPISISCVKYISENKEYEYYGNNYYTNGQRTPVESWHSESATIDAAKQILTYFYKNTHFGSTEKITTGYGTISFKNGIGHFYDLSPEKPIRISHRIIKLSKTDFLEFHGKTSMPSVENWVDLAKFIYKKDNLLEAHLPTD